MRAAIAATNDAEASLPEAKPQPGAQPRRRLRKATQPQPPHQHPGRLRPRRQPSAPPNGNIVSVELSSGSEDDAPAAPTKVLICWDLRHCLHEKRFACLLSVDLL